MNDPADDLDYYCAACDERPCVCEDDPDDDDELWSDAVVCEGAECSRRALFPANHGWTRGEHDGAGLWFCPDCAAKIYGDRVARLLAMATKGSS